MAGNTTMDALIAELLGDVGKLHGDLAALNGALPAMTAATEKQLADVVYTLTATSAMLKKQAAAAGSGRGLSLLAVVLAAVLGAAIGACVTVGMVRLIEPSDLLDKHAAETFQSGQFIERVWPKLDPATRVKIEAAARL